MDAFDRIINRTPEATKRNIAKNLAIANRISEILKGQGKTQRDLARALDKSESENPGGRFLCRWRPRAFGRRPAGWRRRRPIRRRLKIQ